MKEIKKLILVQDARAMGEQAKFERQMKNMTQIYVSKKMGITQAHYSGLENGRTIWSRSMIFKFNKAIRD